jgi:hypothetical protein
MLEIILWGPLRKDTHGKDCPIGQLNLEHLATILRL